MSERLGVFKEEGRRRHLLSSRQIVSSSLLSSVHSKVLSFIPGGGGRESWNALLYVWAAPALLTGQKVSRSQKKKLSFFWEKLRLDNFVLRLNDL